MGRLKAMPARLPGLRGRVAPMPKRADPFYQSVDWKALRAAKKAAGPAYCRVCGAGDGAVRDGRRVRLILDHRAERKDGGADLLPSCPAPR